MRLMLLYILATTAIGTLILNLMLTKYLLKNKMVTYFPDLDKRETINFVLTPPAKSENVEDTEVFETEIIPAGDI